MLCNSTMDYGFGAWEMNITQLNITSEYSAISAYLAVVLWSYSSISCSIRARKTLVCLSFQHYFQHCSSSMTLSIYNLAKWWWSEFFGWVVFIPHGCMLKSNECLAIGFFPLLSLFYAATVHLLTNCQLLWLLCLLNCCWSDWNVVWKGTWFFKQ